jgi:hypothetical protein
MGPQLRRWSPAAAGSRRLLVDQRELAKASDQLGCRATVEAQPPSRSCPSDLRLAAQESEELLSATPTSLDPTRWWRWWG